MKYKELLNSLPKSWEDVDLKTYQRLITTAVYDVEQLPEDHEDYTLQLINNSLVTIAALMNVDISLLRGYKLPQTMELIKATQWISVPPHPKKEKPKYLKDDVHITVDNFLTYQAKAANGKQLDNIVDIVSLFVKDAPSKNKGWFKSKDTQRVPMITAEDIGKMNMVEITTFFFFVQKLLMKSLKRIQSRMTAKLMLLRTLQKLGAQ